MDDSSFIPCTTQMISTMVSTLINFNRELHETIYFYFRIRVKGSVSSVITCLLLAISALNQMPIGNKVTYTCEGCLHTCINKSKLNEHQHICLYGIDKKRFKCDRCPKIFFTKLNRDSHIKVQHLGELLQCTECGKHFKTVGGLQDHQKTHTDGGFQFTCEHCGRGFRNKNHLKLHIAGHLNEKNYVCSKCNAGFNNPYTLKRHGKSCGLSEKPFKCDKCGKGFKTKDTLREHFNTAHKEGKKRICPKCQEVFYHRNSFNKHLLKVCKVTTK